MTSSSEHAVILALRCEVARVRRWMRIWAAVAVLLAAALAGAVVGIWRQG